MKAKCIIKPFIILLFLPIVFGIIFTVAGCELFENNSEEENESTGNNSKEVIIAKLNLLNSIYHVDFYSENQYIYFKTSQFEVILNPPTDSINSILTFKITIPGSQNYNLYLKDKEDKRLRGWVGWGDISLTSTRPDKKLLDVPDFNNVFVSHISNELALNYQHDNIHSSDAKQREGEYYNTYKMLQLQCIIDNLRTSGVNFSFKQKNSDDETIVDFTNVYFHHDFTNPDGSANADSLKNTVNMWNKFNSWETIAEFEIAEIPVQLIDVWADIHSSELFNIGVEIDRSIIAYPLSIHR